MVMRAYISVDATGVSSTLDFWKWINLIQASWSDYTCPHWIFRPSYGSEAGELTGIGVMLTFVIKFQAAFALLYRHATQW